MPMRMRTLLLFSLLSIPFGEVVLSLAVVYRVVQQQIRRDLSADLGRSISTFRNIQTHREQMLVREAGLLAAMPLLKSLMTTADERTIRDGAAEFSHLSGGDLFILASAAGKPVAVFEAGASQDPATLNSVPSFDTPGRSFFLKRNLRLYDVAFQPLYFGPAESGVPLGYVMVGYAIDRRLAAEVGQAAAAQVIFFADGAIAATTLAGQALVDAQVPNVRSELQGGRQGDVWLAGEHFVHASVPLGDRAAPRVQIITLESYDKAIHYVTQLNLRLLTVAAALLVLGGSLAVYVSTSITQPLDRLVTGARSLGSGDFDSRILPTGPRELRELAEAFDRMRSRLKQAREELVASERLATIGRMASSISHDLRHYLSAVYANAEFLGYDSTRAEDRQELLLEVREGIRGMTDLIDSLLLFSRTGESLQPAYESVSYLLERAIAMVRAHPDAQHVRFIVPPLLQLEVWVDIRKVERAFYNLLLNASQAARQGAGPPEVRVSLAETEGEIVVRIEDNGPGVPDSVRQTLFEPFVSAGKPSGTGLGLALSLKVAQEHGGSVTLEQSRDGLTAFRLTLGKSTLHAFALAAQPGNTPSFLS